MMNVYFTAEQKQMLARDLDGKRVAKRQGRGGKSFDYLEVWDVEDRANQIFGFDGWSCETVEMVETWSGTRPFGRDREDRPVMVFRAKVRVTVFAGERTIVKEAWGYGDGSGNDFGEASELAIKEAESDAEKRCFKKFGWQFGLALYDKSQEHVRDGVDDEPLPAGQGAQVAPPAPPAPPPPPPPPPPKPAPAARETRTDPGAPKAKKFPIPEIPDGAAKARREEIWREYTQSIAAAIKSAPNESVARDTLKANIKGLSEMKKSIGFDAVAWATDLIEKRWPPAPPPEEGPAQVDETAGEDGVDESNAIPAPEGSSDVGEWDDWLDLIKAAIVASPDIASGRDIITANSRHFDEATAALEIDVSQWAQAQLDAKFSKQKRAR